MGDHFWQPKSVRGDQGGPKFLLQANIVCIEYAYFSAFGIEQVLIDVLPSKNQTLCEYCTHVRIYVSKLKPLLIL